MASNERDRQLRAELAAELGWYPAELDDESVARHRANAASAMPNRHHATKWDHLAENKRKRDVESAGRAATADLYDSEGIPRQWHPHVDDDDDRAGCDRRECRRHSEVIPGSKSP